MNKHTPGPWVVRDCGKHPPGHEAWKSCAHLADENEQAIPKTFPNMQLQAAAPDLLAALEDLLPELQCWCDVAFTSRGKHQPNTLCHHKDNVKAAIAKARGEKP